MGDGINKKVESKCSTCAFGHCDEYEEPCFTCYNSLSPFCQWNLDSDFVMNLENKMSLQDKGNEG
jgi:hypothetical protein